MCNCAVNWCDKQCFLHLFFLTATTQLLLKIFAQNLAKRLEAMSRKQFYVQISLLRKSKIAAAAILKIPLKAISRDNIWLMFA